MYMYVRHKVSDYDKWKQVFDSDQKVISEAGFKKYGLYRSKDDPNDLIVFLEVTDIEKAKSFLKSEKGISRMKEGTVTGEPEIFVLDLVEKKDFSTSKEKAA